MSRRETRPYPGRRVIEPSPPSARTPMQSSHTRRAAFALAAAVMSLAGCDASGYLAALPTDQNSCISQQCTLAPGDLVFSSDRTGAYQIWTMHADGSSPRQITNQGGV